MRRLISPATNPAGLTAAATAIYALIAAILNVRAHHAAISPQVNVAALSAVAAIVTRFYVTPVADPVVPGKVIADLAPKGVTIGGLNAESTAAIAAEVLRALSAVRTHAATAGATTTTEPVTPS